jgi:hypothetical protein
MLHAAPGGEIRAWIGTLCGRAALDVARLKVDADFKALVGWNISDPLARWIRWGLVAGGEICV